MNGFVVAAVVVVVVVVVLFRFLNISAIFFDTLLLLFLCVLDYFIRAKRVSNCYMQEKKN